MKKVCPGCSEERDIEKDFSWKNIAKGTRQRWCKYCQAIAMKKHYQSNKQIYLANASRHALHAHEESRRKLCEYLTTHPCVDCGYSDIRVLEFDHVHGNKKCSISRMLSTNRDWSTLQAEIKKCEVRCANCHRIKTNERGDLWRNLLVQSNDSSNYSKNQHLLYEYLATHPCIDCLHSDIRVLEFDHVRGNKKMEVGSMTRGYSWQTILTEINKCDIRCANCHRIKTLDHLGSWRSLFSQ